MTLRVLLFMIFIACLPVVNGQSLKDLQNQKKNADREILKINEQLNVTMKQKNTSMKQVTLINSMIQKRKKLITNIDSQIAIVTKNIGQKNDTIGKLRSDIARLKKEYSKTLQQAYKMRGSTSSIALVLASNDLHQAILRMKYLRSYSDYRIQQAKSIEVKQKKLGIEVTDLNSKKQHLVVLLSQKNEEVKKLSLDEKNYEKLVVQLKSKEKELTREIQNKRLLSDRLTREINRIIEEEARKAAEAARRKAAEAAAKAKKNTNDKTVTKSVPVTKELPFTPEDRIIAGKFESNRGRLPWPVRQGIIIEGFGEHFHPVLKGIKVENKGVDIASNAGSEVMSVFDGEVSKIFTVAGANISVLIRHGYYITVYSNLSKVSVREGQKIRAKEVIGVLARDDNGDEKSSLKFQVWKETTPQNPALWLSR